MSFNEKLNAKLHGRKKSKALKNRVPQTQSKTRVDVNRRQFLKQSAQWAGGAAVLTGCASIDSLFTTGKREYDKEVFIIGAGAAGLMAAHTLKKNRIPFRLFEATNRPGGRLYTVAASDGTPLEMGADHFESHHSLVFELLKEFQLEFEETIWDPSNQPLWRSSKGDVLTDADYQKVSTPLVQKMIRNRVQAFGTTDQFQILNPELAKEIDTLSMAQYLKANWAQPDDRVVQFWDAWARTQYSADSEKVSALRWLWDQRPDRRTRNFYRVKGGWESLNKVMFERIAGVIPDHLVRLRWALTKVQKTQDGFRCFFRTPKGVETLETHNIIFAIPVNQYAKIDGFMDLEIAEEKKQALRTIGLGEASKAYISFKPGTTELWEKSFLRNRIQMSYLKTDSNDWVGGLRGGEQSQWTLPDLESWRSGLLSSGTNLKEGQFDYHVINWKDRPFIQGARSLWGPGQWGTYSTIFERGDFDDSLMWAGEFVPSQEKGTVQSALISGQAAGNRMIERIKALTST